MRIRQRRLQLDMSQEALAKELGLTFQQVQKYEKGTNRVSASRLMDLANVLGTDVAYFFDDAPGTAQSRQQADRNDASVIFADRIGVRLCAAFLKIERPDLRAAIVNMIEDLSSNSN